MVLSTTTQHAIRALAQLTRGPQAEYVLGRHLAERAEIPSNFLAKIMLTLRNAGLVEATRGQGGGYRLLVAPEQISLMQIVELFEGVHAKPGCLLGERQECGEEQVCVADERWNVVVGVYLSFLRGTTIADVCRIIHCPGSGLTPLKT